ncbi:MAG TPA: copper resistance protein B [Thermomonas sp.]|jgi:copper resistance protein B|nr:copper resistance protein B [Thermomonas sp.]
MRNFIALPLLLSIGTTFAQEHAHHSMPVQAQTQDAHPAPLQPAEAETQTSAQPAAVSASGYRPAALTDADRAAAFPVLPSHHEHADPLVWMLQADRFEWTQAGALAWAGTAWIGHDRGRLWLRSEGERTHGNTSARLEALWGKPVSAWWDVLAGVRHDRGHGPARDWLAVGVQGLAPYKFEVQATAYLGSGGRSLLHAEVEYEMLLTNKLMLQPRIEASVHGRDDRMRGIGAGLSETSAGLRLRYEIRREFAPYIGYAWAQKHGRTASLAEAAGGTANESGWVAGLRFWF